MAQPPLKTVAGAYGMAVLGLLLGIVGMQRYYLRHYLSATIMTLLFIAGLFFLVSELIVKYYTLLEQLADSLASNNFGNTLDLQQAATISGSASLLGSFLCGVGGIWWLFDLCLLPGMVKKFNREHGAN